MGSTAALKEGGQELELQSGQRQLLIVDPDLACEDVDAEATKGDFLSRLVLILGQASAKEGFNAQDQLPDAKGFDHIIISTDLKADDPVDLLATGGEHEDRDFVCELIISDLAADLSAGHIGEHQIEEDQVWWRFLLKGAQGLFAGQGRAGLEASLLEIIDEGVDQIGLILDDQDER